jgi:hypothetical protein
LVSFLSVELDACMASDNIASSTDLLGFMPIVNVPVTRRGPDGSAETLERMEN